MTIALIPGEAAAQDTNAAMALQRQFRSRLVRLAGRPGSAWLVDSALANRDMRIAVAKSMGSAASWCGQEWLFPSS